MILLVQPFTSGPAADLMKQGQQFWIGPVQGLATASLGAFFVRARSPQSDELAGS
jgi:hypothetical protein